MGRRPKEETAETGNKKLDVIAKLVASMQVKHGKESINFLGNKTVEPIPRLPSGSSIIDEVTGGGYPLGRIIELYGAESSGKSTACYHAIAEAQRAYPDKICAYIDSEFCLASGTLVYDFDSGTNIPVENLSGSEITVLSKIGEKLVPQRALVKYVGKKNVFRIEAERGRGITVTGNHSILTSRGWKTADSLNVGDIVYSPLEIPVQESEGSSEDEKYRLLGYWLGDGCIGEDQIATIDDFVLDDISGIVSRQFRNTIAKFNKCRKSVVFTKKDNNFYNITSNFLLTSLLAEKKTVREIADFVGCHDTTIRQRISEYGIDKLYNLRKNCGRTKNKIERDNSNKKNYKPEPNEVQRFLSSFDVYHKYSYEKYIPGGLNKEQLRHLLAGLFLSDGMAVDSEKQRRSAISFSTSSYRLAVDIQSSLQKFGILSDIYSGNKKRDDGSNYRTSYTVCVNSVRFVGMFYREFGHILCGYKLERIKKSLTLRDITRHSCNGSFVELKIKSIEPQPEVDVFDVSVANVNYDEQNFLANGIVVHNCFDPNYAQKIGVNVGELLVSQPNSGEEAFGLCQSLLENDDVKISLIIVDSVAAMLPRVEADEDDYSKNQMGLQARMMSKALRKLTSVVGRSGAVIIFTNQTRCLPMDAKVYSNKGIVTVESLKKGDKIFNGATFVNVIEKINSGVVEAVRIHARNCDDFRISKNHLQPVVSSGEYIEKEGRNVVAGDWLISPVFTIDVDGVRPSYETIISNIVSDGNGRAKSVEFSEKAKVLSDELSFFLGCYYSDGCMLDCSKGDYVISFTERSEERFKLVEEVSNILFGNVVNAHFSEDSKKRYIRIQSMYVYKFLESLGCRRKERNKIIENDIFLAPNDAVKSFIRGAFFDTQVNKNECYFTNNNLAVKDISNLLYSRFGIVGDVKTSKNGSNLLSISGTDFVQLSESIGFAEKSKQLKASCYVSSGSARGKYDLVPREYALKIFEKFKRIVNEPVYKNKYIRYLGDLRYSKLNASRKKLIEVLRAVDGNVFSEELSFISKNRFFEIKDVSEDSFSASDIEVEGGVFVTDRFLTHNSKIGVMYGSPECVTLDTMVEVVFD